MKNRILIVITCLMTGLFFQQCANDTVVLMPFDTADGKKGGLYYDTFWAKEGGYNQNDTAKIRKLTVYADFFKCKQCHAWDLEANKASYIGRAPNKTRPSVSAIPLTDIIKDRTPEQLFNSIKIGTDPNIRRPLSYDLSTYDANNNKTIGDRMPNYSELLSDEQIWDLVKFLKAETINTKELYDYTTTGTYPTGKITFSNIGKGGDAIRGKTIFVSKGCSASSCHGTTGTAILVDNNTYTIGGFFRAKPQEAQHKIKFGQLGSAMKAIDITNQEMKDLYAAAMDSIAFPIKK